MLQHGRDKYDGKGELALLALDIPFVDWAQMLINASFTTLTPQPHLCEQLRTLQAIKVIYTGSPVEMAKKILERVVMAPTLDSRRIA